MARIDTIMNFNEKYNLGIGEGMNEVGEKCREIRAKLYDMELSIWNEREKIDIDGAIEYGEVTRLFEELREKIYEVEKYMLCI